MLVIQVANLMGYEAVKWVVGAELSLTDVGGYTLIATVVAFAGSMSRSVANVLTPAASRLHSLERHKAKVQLALHSTKYAMIVASALCIMPLLLFKPFLSLWVGATYSKDYLDHLALAGIILLLGQWFIGTAICLLQILTGVGKVKFPAAVILSWAVGGLVVVWAYLHWVNASLMAVVIGITVARVIGSMVQLLYGMQILKLNSMRFVLKAILLPGGVGLAVCGIGGLLMNYLDVYQVSEFILAVIILIFLYLLGTWIISFSPGEREMVISQLCSIGNKSNID
jgi:O-antigen/teichoic acid export membrane protein